MKNKKKTLIVMIKRAQKDRHKRGKISGLVYKARIKGIKKELDKIDRTLKIYTKE